MLFQPTLFETPAKYTPVTSAAIARPAEREWVPIHTQAKVKPVLPFEPAFQPQFETLSARERKLREMGGSDSPAIVGVIPRNLASLGSPTTSRSLSSHSDNRRQSSPLIASTMSWTCPVSPRVEMNKRCVDGKSVRRQTTQLIPATMPWTTAVAQPAATPSVDHRKQTHDLLPSTMVWTTPIADPTMSRPSTSSDFRRRKPLETSSDPEPAGILPGGSPIPVSAGSNTTRRITILRVPVNGAEETTVKKLLAGCGVHVVAAMAAIDIVTNACKGTVDVVVRHDGPLDAVAAAVETAGMRLIVQ